MPVLDLVDDTYLACCTEVVAAAVHQPERWRTWWPGLHLTVTRDRGHKGVQWVAEPAADLPARTLRGRPVRWAGSLEIWLEPWGPGTLVHHYQRLDPRDGTPLRPRQVDRLRAARARAWKRSVHALKDELEHAVGDGRRPGRRGRWAARRVGARPADDGRQPSGSRRDAIAPTTRDDD